VSLEAERKKSIREWAFWLAVAILVAAIIIYLLIWYGPDVLARHDIGNVTGPLRVLRLQQARDAARGRLLTLGAGIFAAGALIFTAQNYRVARRTLEVTEQGQVTDRYTKAIGQLGSKRMDVRIGGIYALERIARDSVRDHPTVMEVLAAFIREHSHEQWPLPESGNAPERTTRPDVQAAVTVVARRDLGHDRRAIDLTRADLTRADLADANLTGTNLADADLTGVDLRDAKAAGVNYSRADLTGANLGLADLTGATLGSSTLSSASLFHAKLDQAILLNADLTGANLTNALLTKADLTGANLTDATLGGATLSGATLGGATLARANLRGAILTDADLADTVLTDTVLTDANFSGAVLTDSNLSGANATRANLPGANLAGAILTGADLTYARLINANLFGANLARAILTGAYLSGALWPPDAVVPEGWQRDADSGRLKSADADSDGAAD
jgi:uncharacterized protein YjbI with pentapeptide repeats